MIGSINFEMGQLEGALRKLAKESNSSMRTLVVKAAKITVQKAIEITPPATGQVKGAEAKKRAEKKVSGDIRRLFASASYAYGTIKNKKAAAAFWRLVSGKNRDFVKAQQVLSENTTNTRLTSAEVAERMDESLHRKNRTRGVVNKNRRMLQVVYSRSKKNGEIDKYVKKKQAMIGFWASGWVPAIIRLKVTRIPKWITKHHNSASRGSCDVPEKATDNFIITIKNKTGFGSLARVIPYALSGARHGMILESARAKAEAIKKAGLKK
jgi:hypothetical protein